ncbi:MAG: hypothetical protein WC181_09215 [Defluviitoga sp.]
MAPYIANRLIPVLCQNTGSGVSNMPTHPGEKELFQSVHLSPEPIIPPELTLLIAPP